MTRILLTAALFTFFVSCGNSENSSKDQTEESATMPIGVARVGTYCFIKTSGNNNKDTLTATLTIAGSDVTGAMSERIWEKDERKGALHGTIAGDTIRADYRFMQEGVTDSFAVEFLVTDTTLLQKEIVYNAKDGRPSTSPAGPFSIVLNKTECAGGKPVVYSGTVTSIERGKDGYMAVFNDTAGDTMVAVVSRVQLQDGYVEVAKGEKVQVAGEVTPAGTRKLVRVSSIKK
jgi:uncharacterized protein YdeI (BOF family)